VKRWSWPLLVLALSACRSETPSPAIVRSATPVTHTVADPVSTAPVSTRSASRQWKAQELTWTFDDTPVGDMVVVVSIPETQTPLPALIALHGLGEAQKGPAAGARGWVDDYGLPRALARLAAPPMRATDWEQLGAPHRRLMLNESLERRPYRGLVVVCPYTPDIVSGDRSVDAAKPLARFLVEQLLPKIRRDTPANATPVGLDGVSLGGRAALLVGLERPAVFEVVGSLQAAIYPADVEELGRRASAAIAIRPELRLRLLTSDGDFYRQTLRGLSRHWQGLGIDHRFDVVRGPHSYAFNRGPGVYEMLLFHDRALRGEPYLP